MITLEELLDVAKVSGASDLHITVGIPPRMRVNGILLNMNYDDLLPEHTQEMALTIMNDQQKKILKDKGEVDFSFSIEKLGRFRANIFKQKGTYAAAIRLVRNEIPDIRDLGLPDSMLSLYQKKGGLIFVTGPAGCGKSTTLASLIDEINKNVNVHIITLESPIEILYEHKNSMVNQREIGLDSRSYANALRAALREDPDVILIGEMEDMETIRLALTAAEMGYFVFSSMHTVGAQATIDRIIEIFPPHQQQQIRFQLASVLEVIISQQLILTSDQKQRVAAYEIMKNTPAIQTLIREGKTQQIPAAMQTERKYKMQMMDDAIFELYIKGLINREEALSYAQDVMALERKLL